MKVQIILRGGYGDRNGVMHKEHSIVDFPDALAAKLIMHKIAVPVRAKGRERAVRKPREQTSKGSIKTTDFFPQEKSK